MASTIWKGTIAFGLLAVPVRITAGARSAGYSFHLLHAKCAGRVSQYRWCEACQETIEYGDTKKGYEDGDETIVLTQKDLDACKPANEKTMEILSVANASEIDPLLFETSYYLEPQTAGKKGFKLLLEALKKGKKILIASVVMFQREHTVAIREHAGNLVFHTLYYESELREAPDLSELGDVKITPQELALAGELLKTAEEKFDHSQYYDGYADRVGKMLEAKRKHKPFAAVKPAAEEQPLPEILDALKASMQVMKKRRAA
jgi:DNA end-binding protein Ku